MADNSMIVMPQQEGDPFSSAMGVISDYSTQKQTLKDAAQARADQQAKDKQAQDNWEAQHQLDVNKDTREQTQLTDDESKTKFDENLATLKSNQEAIAATDLHRAQVLQHYIDNITAWYAPREAAIKFSNDTEANKKAKLDTLNAQAVLKTNQLILQYTPAREARQITADTDTHNTSVATQGEIGARTIEARQRSNSYGAGGRGSGNYTAQDFAGITGEPRRKIDGQLIIMKHNQPLPDGTWRNPDDERKYNNAKNTIDGIVNAAANDPDTKPVTNEQRGTANKGRVTNFEQQAMQSGGGGIVGDKDDNTGVIAVYQPGSKEYEKLSPEGKAKADRLNNSINGAEKAEGADLNAIASNDPNQRHQPQQPTIQAAGSQHHPKEFPNQLGGPNTTKFRGLQHKKDGTPFFGANDGSAWGQ
jgi:hypothetical protein